MEISARWKRYKKNDKDKSGDKWWDQMFFIKGSKLKTTQTFPYPPETKFKLSALIFRGILCLHSREAVNQPQVEMAVWEKATKKNNY